MARPIITTLDGKEYEMRALTGRDWRILGEFIDTAPEYADVDFLEKHAGFIAKFYDGVTAEDILDLPIEEIIPASLAVRNYIATSLSAKLEKIEKNSETGKAQ